MIIRPITVADREEWLRLRQALWPEATPDEHVREMEALLDDPENTAVFVAERPNGRLGGFVETGTRPYAEVCRTWSVGYIEGWDVDPDLRRGGVGRALIEAAEEWARAMARARLPGRTVPRPRPLRRPEHGPRGSRRAQRLRPLPDGGRDRR